MLSSNEEVFEYLSIVQLKHSYCHMIDNRRYDEWLDLFTETGSFGRVGAEQYKGKAGLRRFVENELEGRDEYLHLVSNPFIEVDGDKATGWWNLLYLEREGPKDSKWVVAQYEDQYRCVDDKWRFEEVMVNLGFEGRW